MIASKSEMRRYLLKEQGWDDDVVRSLSPEELREAYEHYTEGY